MLSSSPIIQLWNAYQISEHWKVTVETLSGFQKQHMRTLQILLLSLFFLSFCLVCVHVRDGRTLGEVEQT